MSNPIPDPWVELTLPTLPDLTSLWKTSLNWHPTDEQLTQLQALYRQIWLGNQSLNLTRILEPEDFWEKHLWDSLVGVAAFLNTPPEPGLQLIDVGTGGGFPGLPIAIAIPQWSVTLLDATQKKVNFLQQVQANLQLTQVRTVAGRAEALGQMPGHRENYDLACIRAVGTAAVCAEYTLPLLKMGGQAILYRGQWSEAEAKTLTAAVAQLGGQIETIEHVETPLTQGTRHLVYLRKIKTTPKAFPRGIGIPSQEPL